MSKFRNALAEFVFTRSYCRWVEDSERRETPDEALDRYLNFIVSQRKLPADVFQDMSAAVKNLDVLPSMRALWSAGPSMARDNLSAYNCAFLPIDCIPAFSEALYILMQGTGVGFSVERQFVSNLPTVEPLTADRTRHYVVEDSAEGWANAFKAGLTSWWCGADTVFDFSNIRPAGSRLNTKGGRASGPEPLIRLLDFAKSVVQGAGGRKLFPIEVHDIMCTVGEVVMAGGVRRAALISFSDADDEQMRNAKNWALGEFPACRYMANNSVFWNEKPDRDTFYAEWESLKQSGSGERGMFRVPPQKAKERGTQEMRSNPCGEILLRYKKATNPWTGAGGGGQLCNLSCAVMREEDTIASFSEKVRLAAWIGAVQASFTHFPYLRPAWKEMCEEDRLLGVDITGQCDNPALANDVEAMALFNRVARKTADIAAAWLGINSPAAVTCGKPSGNSSQILDCSSGFHARYSPFYIRRVRISGDDPLLFLVRDAGAPCIEDRNNTWVVEFPVASPERAMLREDETALDQLRRYKTVMDTWCNQKGHNQSATIYVKEEEWESVGAWVYENFDRITGVSFLPYDGGKYELAPYEEIDELEYKRRMLAFPGIDYSMLTYYEQEDKGEGAKELACVGGSCEI